MSAPIIRVIKDGCEVYLEVPGAPSDVFPLWDPELFDRATVRLGEHAKFKDCYSETADVWLAKQRELRKEIEEREKRERGE